MRTIRNNEYEFLARIEKVTGKGLQSLGLSPTTIVEDMADGGMGSLRFPSEVVAERRRLGEVVAQGEFDDEDGVTVSFTINLDSDGRLFELDLWRVDFEPLKRFPTGEEEIRMLADTA